MLDLPHDPPNAYFHANVKDGGLSVPSMRWLMPLHRWRRLKGHRVSETQQLSPYVAQEAGRVKRRLREGGLDICSNADLDMRWARVLHSSVDGRALKESWKVPQQHQWLTEGSRFLSGRNYVNAAKTRINAMPTKSRTAKDRVKDRTCRARCASVETLDHVLQKCFRTHGARIDRHNAVASYVKRSLEKTYEVVEEEPQFNTERGLRKPDHIAVKGGKALVIDAQVVSEHCDLEVAHRKNAAKYRDLRERVRERFRVGEVSFTTVTLSYRGVWSRTSAQELVEGKVIKKGELKIISTRVLVGGLASFWRFTKSTSTARPVRYTCQLVDRGVPHT